MAPSTPRAKPLGVPIQSSNIKDVQPLSHSILLIPTKLLETDEIIRKKLHDAEFLISRQGLLTLSTQESADFVDLISNPRSKLYVDAANLTENEPVRDKVAQLATGPILVLLVEKGGDCVAQLLAFVEQLHSLTSDERYYCTSDTITLSKEVEFCFSRILPAAFCDLEHKPPKRARVDLDGVMRHYLFPSHITHPDALGRLFVFGMYGPLDAHYRLTAGRIGHHVVSDREIQVMIRQIHCEDVYKVYDLHNLSPEELQEVQGQLEKTVSFEPKYTKEMTLKLFQLCQRDENGTLGFEEMQSVIMSERVKRVLRLKTHLTFSSSPSKMSGKWPQRTERSEKCLQKLLDKSKGLSDAQIASLVSQLLSKRSHEICHLEDGNAASLTQNVKLLRPR